MTQSRGVEEATLRSMCAAIAHRGPDDEGVLVEPGVGLGMRRLSIIDLATGHQPISNEDGTVRRRLQRRDLQLPRAARASSTRAGTASRHAPTPRSSSTATSSGAASVVERLRGHVRASRSGTTPRATLLLARDRLGIKPLYYAEHRRTAVRSRSELKSLLAAGGVRRAIDPDAFAPLPARSATCPRRGTIFRGVASCRRRTLADREDGAEPVDATGTSTLAPTRATPDAARSCADELRELLRDAVRCAPDQRRAARRVPVRAASTRAPSSR